MQPVVDAPHRRHHSSSPRRGTDSSPRLGPASMPLFRVPAASARPSSVAEVAGPGLDEAAAAAALISNAQNMLPHGTFGLADRGLALEMALRDRGTQVRTFD